MYAQHWCHVTGLPRAITEVQIAAHMARIGAVAAVQLKEGGASAAVRYWREDDARRAIEAHPYGLTRSKIVVPIIVGAPGRRASSASRGRRTSAGAAADMRRASAASSSGAAPAGASSSDGFIVVQPIKTVTQLVGRRRAEVHDTSAAGAQAAGALARRALHLRASMDGGSGADPLLYVSVDERPPVPAVDFALRIATAALELVYNPQIMDSVSHFFQAVPDDAEMQLRSLSAHAKDYGHDVASKFERVGLEASALLHKKVAPGAPFSSSAAALAGLGVEEAKPKRAIDIDIRMRAPIVLVPEDPRCVHPGMLLMVLDFGRLEVGTVLLSQVS